MKEKEKFPDVEMRVLASCLKHSGLWLEAQTASVLLASGLVPGKASDTLIKCWKLIVNKVIQEKDLNNFRIVEPNIKEHHEFKLYSFEDAVSESDIVVFLVAHNEFSLSKTTNKKTLNFCNVK